jgi:XRE family aerobic/anaerobic benzoate catabolism transcriptional regulator
MALRKPSAIAALRRLGHRVASLRILADLTQEHVADVAGISVQFLRKVERGTGNPSYLTLLAISKALKISLESLVHFGDKE